jgi:hypothetical protein
VLHEGQAFRGAGLFNHPLTQALFNITSIPLIYLTKWARSVKVGAIIVLIAGILAAGGRAATICIPLIAVLGLIFYRGKQRDIGAVVVEKILMIVGLVLVAVVIWLIAHSMGLDERFNNDGLVDDSTMARIIIFQIFGYMDWNELLWGVGNSTMAKFAMLGLDIDSVENSLIVYVFQFGFFGAVCLACALLYTAVALGKNSQLPIKLSLFAFFTVALSNNSLSSKSPALMMIFILSIAFREVASKRKVFIGLRPTPITARI